MHVDEVILYANFIYGVGMKIVPVFHVPERYVSIRYTCLGGDRSSISKHIQYEKHCIERIIPRFKRPNLCFHKLQQIII